MKRILLVLAAVLLVGCDSNDPPPVETEMTGVYKTISINGDLLPLFIKQWRCPDGTNGDASITDTEISFGGTLGASAVLMS